jgi:hypothetical protein
MADQVVEYRPAGSTLTRFHQSDAFARLLVGPVGSGKSVASIAEILARSIAQAPGLDGVRRTRWLVIRGTYGELTSTTLRSWNDWVPARFGRLVQNQPIIHHIQFGDVDMEVNFLSADREDDVKKLLSFEATGCWINEGREVPRSIFNAALARVGRFPAQRNGGCTWSGVILDSNPSGVDHWLHRLFVEERPEGFALFHQPGGRTASAENLANLPKGYYQRLAASMPEDWCRVYVDSQWGFAFDGRAVFTEYSDIIHTAPEVLEPLPQSSVIVGCDFGLAGSAAVFLQKDARGRYLLIHELVAEQTGVETFGRLLQSELGESFPMNDVTIYCDPAANQRSQLDERTALGFLKGMGLPAKAAPTNDIILRLEAVRRVLSRLVDGKPGLMICPNATHIRKALAGGYCYQRLNVSGEERFAEVPLKDQHSHIADALQYALLGAGEGHLPRRSSPLNRPAYSLT